MKTALKNGPPPGRSLAHVSTPEGVIQDTDRITYQMPYVKGESTKMDELTVEQYAELSGETTRNVRYSIAAGTLAARETRGRGGAGGRSFLIPVSSLDPKLKKKYDRLHRQQDPEPLRQIPLEELSEAERQEAAQWLEILKEWKEFRASYDGTKAQADEAFIQAMRQRMPGINYQQMKRKDRSYQEMGAAGLVDRRGKHGGHRRKIPDQVWNVFQEYYLDESRKTVALCMRLTEIYFRKNNIEIPPMADRSTFSREIQKRIPVPEIVLGREGEKAFKDKCGEYIVRDYEDLNSNDIWVCDNHTFDIFINDGEKVKPSRVYLTGFLDVRSRKMVGWHVTMTPNSQATLYALRRGIERYGIPKRILADNGREFLTHDIGGRGHRKSADWGHEAPTILQHLGIDFHTALVRNARSKIIERAFRDIKECFSRVFEGYTGGTPAERPERLKRTGRYAENFTPIEDFVRYVDKYIEGIYNFTECVGAGMYGKSRNEVYTKCLIEKRTAAFDELNLMLMRNSKPCTVQRAGVRLPMYDAYIWFNSEELLFNHIGKKVYFRFNPDDLNEVRVYDEQDRFLCMATQQGKLSYYASVEEVKEKMQQIRSYERLVKNWREQRRIEVDDALALTMWQAEQNLAAGEPQLDPAVITPIRYKERHWMEEFDEAAGSEGADMIDYSWMLEKMKG